MFIQNMSELKTPGRREITIFALFLFYAKIKLIMVTATIEIGHTYADGERLLPGGAEGSADFTHIGHFGSIEFMDTLEAQRLRCIAQSLGGPAMRVALIDDTLLRERQGPRPKWTSENHGEKYAGLVNDWVRWERFVDASVAATAFGAGVETDKIFFERSFEKEARDIVQKIISMELPVGYRLSQNQSRLKIGPKSQLRTIPLQGYKGVGDPTFPSCEVLDLAWLQKRLTIAPKAVTVLPGTDFYSKEQANLATLAALIGISHDSHETIFINPGE
jgi:hypothetical protein